MNNESSDGESVIGNGGGLNVCILLCVRDNVNKWLGRWRRWWWGWLTLFQRHSKIYYVHSFRFYEFRWVSPGKSQLHLPVTRNICANVSTYHIINSSSSDLFIDLSCNSVVDCCLFVYLKQKRKNTIVIFQQFISSVKCINYINCYAFFRKKLARHTFSRVKSIWFIMTFLFLLWNMQCNLMGVMCVCAIRTELVIGEWNCKYLIKTRKKRTFVRPFGVASQQFFYSSTEEKTTRNKCNINHLCLKNVN